MSGTRKAELLHPAEGERRGAPRANYPRDRFVLAGPIPHRSDRLGPQRRIAVARGRAHRIWSGSPGCDHGNVRRVVWQDTE